MEEPYLLLPVCLSLLQVSNLLHRGRLDQVRGLSLASCAGLSLRKCEVGMLGPGDHSPYEETSCETRAAKRCPSHLSQPFIEKAKLITIHPQTRNDAPWTLANYVGHLSATTGNACFTLGVFSYRGAPLVSHIQQPLVCPFRLLSAPSHSSQLLLEGAA
jgi:hypothetical protein